MDLYNKIDDKNNKYYTLLSFEERVKLYKDIINNSENNKKKTVGKMEIIKANPELLKNLYWVKKRNEKIKKLE